MKSNVTVKSPHWRRYGRGKAISLIKRQGLITTLGPWALTPHAEEETFWPSPVGAAPVKIYNADGTLREIVDAVTFKSRGLLKAQRKGSQ